MAASGFLISLLGLILVAGVQPFSIRAMPASKPNESNVILLQDWSAYCRIITSTAAAEHVGLTR